MPFFKAKKRGEELRGQKLALVWMAFCRRHTAKRRWNNSIRVGLDCCCCFWLQHRASFYCHFVASFKTHDSRALSFSIHNMVISRKNSSIYISRHSILWKKTSSEWTCHRLLHMEISFMFWTFFNQVVYVLIVQKN